MRLSLSAEWWQCKAKIPTSNATMQHRNHNNMLDSIDDQCNRKQREQNSLHLLLLVLFVWVYFTSVQVGRKDAFCIWDYRESNKIGWSNPAFLHALYTILFDQVRLLSFSIAVFVMCIRLTVETYCQDLGKQTQRLNKANRIELIIMTAQKNAVNRSNPMRFIFNPFTSAFFRW